MCSQYSISDDVPCVVIDDYAAAQNAVSYLISIGKKRIALMNSQQDYSCSLYRENGYLDTLKEAGLPVYPEFITHVKDVYKRQEYIQTPVNKSISSYAAPILTENTEVWALPSPTPVK